MMCHWLTAVYAPCTTVRFCIAIAAVASCSRPPPPRKPATTADLVAALGAPDPEGWRHRVALEALGRRGDPAAIGRLAAIVEAEAGKHEFFLRRLAARALGGIRDARSAEILTRNLLRAEGPLSLEDDCRDGLVRLGAIAVPALGARLDGDRDLATAAARALGAIADPAARAALARARERSVGPTRRAIDEALAAGAPMWDKGAPDSGVKK
jgi:HEAT repeat protein